MQQSQIKQNGNLSGLFDTKLTELARSLNCVQIGTIQSFDTATQTAVVKINFKRIINGELREYAPLIDVPCVVMNGGGGGVSFPIKEGDVCVVLFNDRNIDTWFASGQVLEPETARTHDFSDAIAIVGINSMASLLKNYLASGTRLWYNGSQIKLEDGKITIDNSSSTVVLEGGTVTITASSINLSGHTNITGGLTVDGIEFASHIHSGVQGGSSNTGGVAG